MRSYLLLQSHGFIFEFLRWQDTNSCVDQYFRQASFTLIPSVSKSMTGKRGDHYYIYLLLHTIPPTSREGGAQSNNMLLHTTLESADDNAYECNVRWPSTRLRSVAKRNIEVSSLWPTKGIIVIIRIWVDILMHW